MIVVFKEVGKGPVLKDIGKITDYKELKSLVGHPVTAVPGDDQGRYDMIVAAGKTAKQLKPNFRLCNITVYGNIVLIRNNSEGDYISIPDNERQFALDYAKSFEKGQQNYV